VQASETFLYYAHAAYPIILPALNEIVHMQAKPTKKTPKACQKLMDYLHTHLKRQFDSMPLTWSSHLFLMGLVLFAQKPEATLPLCLHSETTHPYPNIKPNGVVHVM